MPNALPEPSCPALALPGWFWRVVDMAGRGNPRSWLDRELVEAFINERERANDSAAQMEKLERRQAIWRDAVMRRGAENGD